MAASADISGKFALDVQAVNGLRINVQNAQRTGKTGLEAAAKQFEALFLNMMLKSMREASSEDSLLDSDQSRLYSSMLDQQLSQSMASRGIGLADMMVRQLGQGSPTDLPEESAVPAFAPASTQPGAEISPQSSPQRDGRTQYQNLPHLPQQANTLRPQHAEPSHQLSRELPLQGAIQPRLQSQVAEFQNKMMPHARQASEATGIPARFMLGQAALESGWGKREIRTADGMPSHNLFGVKAGGNWKGPVVEAVTTEYVNGVAQKSVEKFRAYSSYADAFTDYANLLRNNPRYANVLAQAAQGLDAEGFAHGLQRAGYATDPNYADKLSRIIKSTPWS